MNRLLNLIQFFLGLMVLTLPFTFIPERYQLPILGNNLPKIFLLFTLIFYCIYCWYNRNFNFFWKSYFVIFFLWSGICLILGCLNFPYYNNFILDYLRNSRMIIFFSKYFPAIQGNSTLLYAKMCMSYFWYMMKDFFFPFAGIGFILYGLLKKENLKDTRKYLITAIYILSIIMVLYSIPEVIWLWTGNETCAQILSVINSHLYDPAHYNNWWPPLLWEGQLRSLCLEPSYFGIIASFLIPFLIIDIYGNGKKYKVAVLFMLVFMIFMTKARTATVIYFGECLIFIILSLIIRYNKWKKTIFTLAMITVCAYSVFLTGSSILHPHESLNELAKTYFTENVASVAKTDQRSNKARFGSTIAMVNVGLDHPVTGVGMGLHAPYMAERIPEFAKEDREIQNWIKDMHQKSFLESGIPVLNEYAAIFAWEGVPGLLLFLIPPIIVLRRGILNCVKIKSFESVGLLTALCGQLACMLSSEMFLTYPLTLWIAYFTLENERNICTEIETDDD